MEKTKELDAVSTPVISVKLAALINATLDQQERSVFAQWVNV